MADEAPHFTMARCLSLRLTYNNPCSAPSPLHCSAQYQSVCLSLSLSNLQLPLKNCRFFSSSFEIHITSRHSSFIVCSLLLSVSRPAFSLSLTLSLSLTFSLAQIFDCQPLSTETLCFSTLVRQKRVFHHFTMVAI